MKDYCSKCQKYVEMKENVKLTIGRESITTYHCSLCNVYIRDLTVYKKDKVNAQ